MDKIRFIGAAILLLASSGCIPVHSNGTTHYVVVGFGIVSVPQTNQAAAQVVKMQSIGLSISDVPGTRFSVGYASGTTVAVPANTNIIVEVAQKPFAPIKITATK